jgi:hypothetical protein
MTINGRVFGELAEAILENGAISAMKFFDEKTRVKATRRLFNGKVDKRHKEVEILFTVGPPNFWERKFVKRVGIAKAKIGLKCLWPKKGRK